MSFDAECLTCCYKLTKRNVIIAEVRVIRSIIHVFRHLDYQLQIYGALNVGSIIQAKLDICIYCADIVEALVK